jgi:hypothetical protein
VILEVYPLEGILWLIAKPLAGEEVSTSTEGVSLIEGFEGNGFPAKTGVTPLGAGVVNGISLNGVFS